ncbi:metal ABC transporter ATP-binding protein [Clostridium neuense]|uniref:Metal ABC transporter ATP-binding protein n=1 Tax=Clostridium neuense TaxID=1728934 RepID=A0ABW8TE58_9CLOT
MIDIKNLCFSYTKSSDYILNNINIEIKDGTYTSIIGENGCGKSTLVKLILKLLSPSSGTIETNSKRISYVPQVMENFNFGFPITVFEILNCHMKTLHLRNSSIISNSLRSVGMSDFKNSLIGDLSGGQRQKIFIARALIGNPDTIIMDEPSTGIDTKSQNDIYTTLKHLNRNNKVTIISVEHNLKAAYSCSTHILKLDSGNGVLLKTSDFLHSNLEVIQND